MGWVDSVYAVLAAIGIGTMSVLGLLVATGLWISAMVSLISYAGRVWRNQDLPRELRRVADRLRAPWPSVSQCRNRVPIEGHFDGAPVRIEFNTRGDTLDAPIWVTIRTTAAPHLSGRLGENEAGMLCEFFRSYRGPGEPEGMRLLRSAEAENAAALWQEFTLGDRYGYIAFAGGFARADIATFFDARCLTADRLNAWIEAVVTFARMASWAGTLAPSVEEAMAAVPEGLRQAGAAAGARTGAGADANAGAAGPNPDAAGTESAAAAAQHAHAASAQPQTAAPKQLGPASAPGLGGIFAPIDLPSARGEAEPLSAAAARAELSQALGELRLEEDGPDRARRLSTTLRP